MMLTSNRVNKLLPIFIMNRTHKFRKKKEKKKKEKEKDRKKDRQTEI